nr:transposase [uncultured Draconibacterium sp.]
MIYLKQNTSLRNHIQSLESRGVKSGVLIRSLKRQLKQVRQEIDLLEAEMQSLIHQYDADLFVNLSSIPGIGKKTAAFLIILTNGFRDFDNYRQVSSFCVLSPTEHSSDTSVKGRSRISKRGNPYIRNQLFMCSFTACQCNAQCRSLYQRLVNKGKSKKLALIAVCNKLIKQAFSIAKSGIPYDPDYRSSIAGQ